MLIKSNFKDYYDFLQGKYGVDTKVVYERVQETLDRTNKLWSKGGMHVPRHKIAPYSFVRIAFCGLMYPVWHINGRMYNAYETQRINTSRISSSDMFTHRDSMQYTKSWKEKTDINETDNCPVVLLSGWGEGVKNIKLSDYSFGKLVDPEDAYTRIYDFLIREPIIKDNRTDIERVVSAGFDKKTSFRNM